MLLRDLLSSVKKPSLLLLCGGLKAKIMRHFFLEIVTSKHIVSEVLSSYTNNLLAIKPSLIKIISPHHFCHDLA